MTNNGASAPRDVLRIRQLNDAFRTTLQGGCLVVTQSISALPVEIQAEILKAVVTFQNFTPDMDPNGERDFLSVDVGAYKIFAKIDYYDKAMRFGSPDCTDPAKTTRLLTVMLASDY